MSAVEFLANRAQLPLLELPIVLDKSYLDGEARDAVLDLGDHYTVLMPEQLFYELMTTSPESQARCFSKLPSRESPVALIPHVGFFIRVEFEGQRACVPLFQHRVDKRRYAFTESLRSGTLVPRAEDVEHLTA